MSVRVECARKTFSLYNESRFAIVAFWAYIAFVSCSWSRRLGTFKTDVAIIAISKVICFVDQFSGSKSLNIL